MNYINRKFNPTDLNTFVFLVSGKRDTAKTLGCEMNDIVFNEIKYFFKLMIIINLQHRKNVI